MIPANNMSNILPNPHQYATPLIRKFMSNSYSIPGYSQNMFSTLQKPVDGTYDISIKDTINAQANDPGYYDKAVNDMHNYLSSNGDWVEESPGMWHNKAHNTRFNFNQWKSNANSNASVNMVSSFNPMYIQPYDGKGPISDVDPSIRYDQVQLNPMAVNSVINQVSKPGPYKNTGNADNSLFSTSYQSDIQNLGLVGGHEINHDLMKGVFEGMVPKGYSYNGMLYALKPSEHFPAAAKFHRQYYANTGKTMTPETFWDGINEAKANIGDYDSESRRFLENTDYQNQNKDIDPHARQMMDSTINNISIFRGNRK